MFVMGPSRDSCHYKKRSTLFQTGVISERLKLVIIALKLKHFRRRLPGLPYMLHYIKDKRSYRVTKVIFRAVVNPSTTTIHRPAGNRHQTKKSQPDLFRPILLHQKTINRSYTEKIREGKRLAAWTCYLQPVISWEGLTAC